MREAVMLAVRRALRGRDAFVPPSTVVQNLTAATAGRRVVSSLPTPWEILCHVLYWQRLLLACLQGETVTWPASADEGWPACAGPRDDAEWVKTVNAFLTGLDQADHILARAPLDVPLTSWPEADGISAAMTLAVHNAYHLGQLVQLRRLMGQWPPPSGGDTW